MSYAVVDIESNGLLYDATKIHCICWEDQDGNKYEAIDDFSAAIAELNKYEKIVGHNFMGYDLPLLEKLGYQLEGEIVDTMIMSSLLDPDRPKGHSLEAYSPSEKVQNEQWDVLTDNMLERCRVDVKLTHKLFKQFTKKMADWDWSEAMSLEHDIAYYHSIQVLNGVKVNIHKARMLYVKIITEMEDIASQLIDRIGYRLMHKDDKPWLPFKADGKEKANTVKYYGMNKAWGPSTRLVLEPIYLNSFVQIKEYLLEIGWKPDEWSYKKDPLTKRVLYDKGKPVKSSPKITESSMAKLDSELGKLLARYFILKHRSIFIYKEKKNGKLGGLIPNVRKDGRVSADGFPLGTNTRRYRHRNVVNVPKAKEDILYGYELRDLFTHEEGTILCGTDADSLEARIAAHFTHKFGAGYDPDKDVHTELKEYLDNELGIQISRQDAKQIYYGVQYGAQVKKVGDMLGVGQTKATQVFDAFWTVNDALAQVRDEAVKEWKHTGFVTALDGGKLSIRSEHSVMNAKFQAAGSIVVKRATVRMNQEIRRLQLSNYVRQVIHYHDEYALELVDSKSIRESIKKITEEAWQYAGDYYKLNVAITGEAAFGSSWAEIH